jgi:hypothetical protein
LALVVNGFWSAMPYPSATPCFLQKPDYEHGGTDEALAEILAADSFNFLMGLLSGFCANKVS